MKSKAPPQGGEASRNCFAGHSCGALSLASYQAQHLASRFALAPETAAIVAALAFGGGAHG